MGGGGKSSGGGGGDGATGSTNIPPRPKIIDTSDLEGSLLRKVILDMGKARDDELNSARGELQKVRDMQDLVEKDLENIIDDISGFLENNTLMHPDDRVVQPGTPEAEDGGYKRRYENEQRYMEMHEKGKEIRKKQKDLFEIGSKLQSHIKERETVHKEAIYKTLEVGEGKHLEVDITITKNTQLVEYEEKIQKQARFIEKLWVKYPDSEEKMHIHAKGKKGGGAFSSATKHEITLGLDYITTSPVHETVHQIEQRSKGAEKKRRDAYEEFLKKKLNVTDIGKVEVEKKIWYIEKSTGKKIYARDTTNKEPIYVPKGLFKSDEEQIEHGYAHRVYSHDVEERQGKKYIKLYPSRYLGIEIPTVGAEELYKDPVKYARDYPEEFDIVINTYRNKL
jgi:hypothetical protein